MAEHALTNGDDRTLFDQTDVQNTTQNYHPRMVREAVEIHKHRTKRKEEQATLNIAWKQSLCNSSCAVKCKFPPPQIPINIYT